MLVLPHQQHKAGTEDGGRIRPESDIWEMSERRKTESLAFMVRGAVVRSSLEQNQSQNMSKTLGIWLFLVPLHIDTIGWALLKDQKAIMILTQCV